MPHMSKEKEVHTETLFPNIKSPLNMKRLLLGCEESYRSDGNHEAEWIRSVLIQYPLTSQEWLFNFILIETKIELFIPEAHLTLGSMWCQCLQLLDHPDATGNGCRHQSCCFLSTLRLLTTTTSERICIAHHQRSTHWPSSHQMVREGG